MHDERAYHPINLAIDTFNDREKSLGLLIIGKPAATSNSAGCFILSSHLWAALKKLKKL
jgi:hypothetical protein